MVLFSLSFEGTRTISKVSQNLPSCHFLIDMLMLLLSYIPLIGKSKAGGRDSDGSSEEYNSASPLLVPVPTHCMVESMKEQLQVVEYSDLLEKSGGAKEGDSQCAVCLNCIREDEEVRELGNCSHVFHKECIDVWMDQGQGTCPLCRSKLLPETDEQGKKLEFGEDPWRRERMIYLFGEDFLMSND